MTKVKFWNPLTFAVLLLVTSSCSTDILAQDTGRSSNPSLSGLSLVETVRYTLSNHPNLRIQQQQVNINKGARQEASAIFDTTFGTSVKRDNLNSPLTHIQQSVLPNPALDDQTAGIISTNLYAGKLFRNGISVSPVLDLARNTDNLTRSTGVSTSHMGIVVTIPMLRGRGRSIVAAQENAADLEVDASLYDLNHLLAQLIVNTASSYWGFVAAKKNLEIAWDAEARGKVYVDSVQTLIDAGHAPKSDINEVEANRAQRSATLINAEQQVEVARQQLAVDLGLQSDQILDVSEPSDDFPDPQGQTEPSDHPAAIREYIGQALSRRADLLAAQMRERESRSLIKPAEDQSRPQWDLNLGTGFSGLQEGLNFGQFLSAPWSRIGGADLTMGFTYTFAPRNSSAHGRTLEAKSRAEQASLVTEDTARKISSGVVVAVKAVRNSMEQLKEAHNSVNAFQSALSAEKEKYRLGIGSIVNILTIEDKLNQASLTEVQAKLAYAIALVQLRFATGTLVDTNQSTQVIVRDMFFNVLSKPDANGPVH
jgi:outer membrane protein